jgi:hypothetical protein
LRSHRSFSRVENAWWLLKVPRASQSPRDPPYRAPSYAQPFRPTGAPLWWTLRSHRSFSGVGNAWWLLKVGQQVRVCVYIKCGSRPIAAITLTATFESEPSTHRTASWAAIRR